MLVVLIFVSPLAATTEIYTLSLHDALPIFAMKCPKCQAENRAGAKFCEDCGASLATPCRACGAELTPRSEEHTSELQSLRHLVCRLLLEKKKRQHRPRHQGSNAQALLQVAL